MSPCPDPASLAEEEAESGEEVGQMAARREELGEERAGASGELSEGMLPLETELEETRLEPGWDRQYLQNINSECSNYFKVR